MGIPPSKKKKSRKSAKADSVFWFQEGKERKERE